ncbi:oxidoreductase [Solicola sp. PLA-1-18]|uniref:oxidoreductase n=1 Tax=Solicola sp. PLA-1-18 TaxID=3380532 RepID=UPI003B7E4440
MAADPFDEHAHLEGVPSAFAGVRDGMDALLRDRGLRRSTPDVTGESLLRGADASASLETGTSDLEALREGRGDAVAMACARMSTQLLGLVPVWQRSPLQALARVHALVAAGQVPDEDLGRPFQPSGSARLGTLARTLAQPTQAPGLLVAAMVHAEVVAANAFVSHNAVVARAAERLVMVARGVDPASVTVPEAGHAARPRAYAGALEAYAGGEPAGVHRWLLYSAEALALGVEATPLSPR